MSLWIITVFIKLLSLTKNGMFGLKFGIGILMKYEVINN